MGRTLGNWRIIFAAFFSVALIVGTYLLTRSIKAPAIAQASEEAALLQAIATKDSDGDGLADWEEALYGTSPSATDSFNLGMTDGAAVAKGLIVPKAISDIPSPVASADTVASIDPSLPPPPSEGTLTAAFAKNFFTLYLAAKQAKDDGDLSETDMAEVANQALSSLSSAITVAPNFKAVQDLTVSGSGADALKQFAIDAEVIALKNSANATTSELTYLMNAVKNNDASALTNIASIARAYREGAAGIAALPVPQELAADVLLLVNAMMRLSEIISDFARVNDDPLATMLALQQYPQAVISLGTAFIHIGRVYTSAGLSLSAGSPGASFVNIIADAATEQGDTSRP